MSLILTVTIIVTILVWLALKDVKSILKGKDIKHRFISLFYKTVIIIFAICIFPLL